MSWDISILDLPSDAVSVADIPDDFEPQPLGKRVDFIDALLTRLGRRAIDCSEGELFSPATSGESLRARQRYRDSVVRAPSSDGS